MDAVTLLRQIQHEWIIRIANQLAEGEGVRTRFREYLQYFFNQIIDTLTNNDPSILEQAILEWAKSETESELIIDRSSLIPILSQISITSLKVARENLTEAEALYLSNELLPIFFKAMEIASEMETRNRVQHIEANLGKTRQILEKLEKSKSDFISVAAHELKTPLTLIEGYSSMIKEAYPREDDRKLQAGLCIKGIETGTRRLREIVDDMIDVSMIDNNLLSLNFQPVWMNHLFESARNEIKDILSERKIVLDLKKFPGSSEMIYADGERLFQVYRNMLSNAIKYTPDGGTITIDGRLLPGFVEVTITDTGIGIDPDNHTKIFEKFGRLGDIQLHSSGKTKFKGGGPGLGLPIAKGIIDAHGGTIWVESKGYDEINYPGSIFHIMIPARKTLPDERPVKILETFSPHNNKY